MSLLIIQVSNAYFKLRVEDQGVSSIKAVQYATVCLCLFVTVSHDDEIEGTEWGCSEC
jgi:hypothetical protein